ncbi:hypothetical protein BDQ17DRAFT_391370 [Cyathus striatus]|nr:hypothetical protein BDQ17DRAFT_391370 [Cyathus striatus]
MLSCPFFSFFFSYMPEARHTDATSFHIPFRHASILSVQPASCVIRRDVCVMVSLGLSVARASLATSSIHQSTTHTELSINSHHNGTYRQAIHIYPFINTPRTDPDSVHPHDGPSLPHLRLPPFFSMIIMKIIPSPSHRPAPTRRKSQRQLTLVAKCSFQPVTHSTPYPYQVMLTIKPRASSVLFYSDPPSRPCTS